MLNTEEPNISYGSLSMERLQASEQVTLYRRRWYLLFLYSLLGFLTGFGTTFYGSVEHALILAFNWTKSEITLLGLWPIILFLIITGPITWLLDNKGLRPTFLVASGCLTAGYAVQCITSTPMYASWTFQLAQMLIGMASPAISGGQALFAFTWFPPYQSNVAISCATAGIFIGTALSAIIGPIAVPLTKKDDQLGSIVLNSTSNISMIEPIDVLRIRKDIMIYVYIQFGVALAVSLAVWIYFPTKPPTPPSVSASTPRMSYKNGIKSMARIPMFWIILVISSATGAINGAYNTLLDLVLLQDGIPRDQIKTGQMQLGNSIGSIVLSFIASSFVDRFKSLSKHVLTASVIMGSALMLWFALLLQGIFVPSTGPLYVSFIAGTSLVLAGSPINFELACDVTFPVGEGITGGVLVGAGNVGTGIFLLIQMIPNIGAQTINWICFGTLCLCVPLCLLFKPAKPRT